MKKHVVCKVCNTGKITLSNPAVTLDGKEYYCMNCWLEFVRLNTENPNCVFAVKNGRFTKIPF